MHRMTKKEGLLWHTSKEMLLYEIHVQWNLVAGPFNWDLSKFSCISHEPKEYMLLTYWTNQNVKSYSYIAII